MIEFKIQDFFYPWDLLKTTMLLWQSEHWTPQQFSDYQAKHLTRLMIACGSHVPYYRELFQSLGIQCHDINETNVFDIYKKLPVLGKDTLRTRTPEFKSDNAAQYHPKSVTTSGTTGTPLELFWDKGSNVMEFCSIQRLWRWARFLPGQSFLDIRSRIIANDANHLVEENGIRYLYNWKVRGLEFTSDLMDSSNINAYYDVLLKYKPRLVRGHPQSIQHLVQLLTQKGLTDWKPKAVTSASETLFQFQRNQIESAWHVPVLDSYGLTEHNVFIAQCADGGYHISPEYGICEILDDNGQPVAAGEEGWIVVTSLHNYVQPLIKYNTLDRAVSGGDRQCSCGRTLPLIDKLIGRITDCLYTEDGRRFSGTHFPFYGRKGIVKARLIQEDFQQVNVEVVATEAFNQTEEDILLDLLNKKVDNKLQFQIKRVNEIKQSVAGKYRFVVSKVKPKEE